MFGAGLITFCETLEAALVVGIIVSILTKTNLEFYKKFVIWGVGTGILSAVILSYVLNSMFGGLPDSIEPIFEGSLMFITAGFLTWMILWVHRQKDMITHIKTKITKHAKEGYGLGIFFLTLTSILREGTEAVLYLKATSLSGSSNQLWGAGVGILLALFIGVLTYYSVLKINIKKVFTITSLFLILFAAGMVMHGVHEFQEVHLLPIFLFDPLFNVSQFLDHESTFGSFLRILFGYTSKPTVLELVSYGSYLIFIFWLEGITDRMIAKKIS